MLVARVMIAERKSEWPQCNAQPNFFFPIIPPTHHSPNPDLVSPSLAHYSSSILCAPVATRMDSAPPKLRHAQSGKGTTCYECKARKVRCSKNRPVSIT